MYGTAPILITPPVIADGPTLTAASAASCIPPECKITLPNNYWYRGRQWRLRASGRISNVVTTPGTARFDLRIAAGPVICFDTLAMPLNVVAKTNVPWFLDVKLTCRVIGNGTGTQLFAQGHFCSESVIGSPAATAGGSGIEVVPYNTAPAIGTGFDNTTSNAVDFFFTQTVATGSMTLHDYEILELN